MVRESADSLLWLECVTVSVLLQSAHMITKKTAPCWLAIGNTVVWWIVLSPCRKRVPGLTSNETVWSLYLLPICVFTLTGLGGL